MPAPASQTTSSPTTPPASSEEESPQLEVKPWFALPKPNRAGWHVAGNNENHMASLARDIASGDDIEALIILQDCNIAGQYYRHFWWIKGDDKRFCDITSHWMLDSEEGVPFMEPGDVVTVCNKYKFKVSPTNCSEFYKIFERVYESTPPSRDE